MLVTAVTTTLIFWNLGLKASINFTISLNTWM